jgi:hypothetical protein
MDDIIIISKDLEDFKIICQIITEILEYMDMRINKSKTYFLTNSEEQQLEISIGYQSFKPTPKDTNVEYLGYWIDMDGNDNYNNQIETSTTIAKLNKLANKKIPLEAKVNIINNVILKSPEYKWNFHTPSYKTIKTISQAIKNAIKHSIPMSNHTASEFIWTEKEKCGLNVNHPKNVADTTILSTFNRLSSYQTPALHITQTAIINHSRTYAPVNPIFSRSKPDKWTKPNKKTIPSNYIEQVNIAAHNNNMMIYNKYNVLTTRKKFQESYDKTPFESMFKLKKKGKKHTNYLPNHINPEKSQPPKDIS